MITQNAQCCIIIDVPASTRLKIHFLGVYVVAPLEAVVVNVDRTSTAGREVSKRSGLRIADAAYERDVLVEARW